MEITYQDTNMYQKYIESIQDPYTSSVKTFINFALQSNRGFNLFVLREYFQWLNLQSYKPATVRLKRVAAINRLRKLVSLPGSSVEVVARFEWELNEICKEIPQPKMPFVFVGTEKIINTDDYQKLIQSTMSDRQRCFITFLYNTGCRVSEMRSIRLKHCTNINGTIYASVLGKGKKERNVRIRQDMFNNINQVFHGNIFLFETQEGKQYDCSYVSTEISKVTQRALGRKLSAHKLRHSWATNMVGKGCDPVAVTAYLGNVNVAHTLAVYSHNELTNDQLFDSFSGKQ